MSRNLALIVGDLVTLEAGGIVRPDCDSGLDRPRNDPLFGGSRHQGPVETKVRQTSLPVGRRSSLSRERGAVRARHGVRRGVRVTHIGWLPLTPDNDALD